jgi:hypothetical protein
LLMRAVVVMRTSPPSATRSLDEPEFVEKSVEPLLAAISGGIASTPLKAKLEPIRIMTDELGPLPANVDPFERCNLWLMYSALACGMDKLRFIRCGMAAAEMEK